MTQLGLSVVFFFGGGKGDRVWRDEFDAFKKSTKWNDDIDNNNNNTDTNEPASLALYLFTWTEDKHASGFTSLECC